MAWLVLIGSGVLEAVWASALAASDGFKRLRPTVVFLVATVASVYGLGWAMQHLPTGTAYAVWTSIGAVGTAAWAMVNPTEPATLLRIALLLGIVACVAGLKVVA